jgi:hypothetical protein
MDPLCSLYHYQAASAGRVQIYKNDMLKLSANIQLQQYASKDDS